MTVCGVTGVRGWPHSAVRALGGARASGEVKRVPAWPAAPRGVSEDRQGVPTGHGSIRLAGVLEPTWGAVDPHRGGGNSSEGEIGHIERPG